MNVNLIKDEMYVRDLAQAAHAHTKKLNMETKRKFDSEAGFFKKHAIALNPKIERSWLKQKDICFIVGDNKNINHAVLVFQGEQFTQLEQLHKMCKKRLEKLKPFVKAQADEEVQFELLGATANLDVATGRTKNQIVACARFVSSVRVHNFCML